ncbi:hypothetical protein LX16_4097 [Stackebrandtia albiflava]|uniref:Uncharacterized protein n=1 Tax=Stackebrandtia albiflava TaxID=406432 RepID=A0A562UYK2_9ACTN|nr:hypothetical protein [Stackebrandtia albiflava]TWJ10677.1 hypothetical protein LX16_4097 [Stackebrandtia albiflava]
MGENTYWGTGQAPGTAHHRPPEPDIDYQPVEIDVDSVGGFGTQLLATATNLGTATPGIVELLKDPDGKYDSGMPLGNDPRQTTLHALGVSHTEQMAAMTDLIENVQRGIENLGLITNAIVTQFGDRDVLNGADVTAIDAAIYGPPSTDPSTGSEV